MNAETLETLLIDRALGRHSAEVEALLGEYLATNPEAAKTAEELNEVVTLATAALRRPVSPHLEPPARLEGLFWFHRANRLLALAASFTIGAGIALLAVWRSGSSRETPPLAKVSPPPPARIAANALPPELVRATRSLPFWSQQRAYLLAGAAKESRPPANSQ